MQSSLYSIPFQDTGYFTSIVSDYLSGKSTLQPFYKHTPDISGIQKAIEARKNSPINRQLLQTTLINQYAGMDLGEKLSLNIRLLADEKTFSITTAHQPNIFTGPLYFIYKCMHAIRLADFLNEQFPDLHFVPVYYMGSEDADLDEIGQVTVGGIQYVWKTNQTGSVGRMLVDQSLIDIISQLEGQSGVLPFGAALSSLWRKSFTKGKTISQAMLEMVHSLLGDRGLIVINPDQPALKSCFTDIVKRELFTQFSHPLVEATNQHLSEHYKVQAAGRSINLFYLNENRRERIEKITDDVWAVPALPLQFTRKELEDEIQLHPERFSANVILRGLYQEMILPNIVFIGGGGELAYWLELQSIFTATNVPFPVLLLRNSFLLLTKAQETKWLQTGFSMQEIFQQPESLIKKLAILQSGESLSLHTEILQLQQLYQEIARKASQIDKSLQPHTGALEKAATEKIEELEKKMLRAEKRKYAESEYRIQAIREQLFPNNGLQERTENMALYYARWGKTLLDEIYFHSQAIAVDFGMIVLPND
ncbi:MAG: bacillithiol biosynthesis cysteine-adding enzyme BshC [Chitinophagia bacterium]|nr:bacillithiol biosynthesis cysteine-adding enzyme BshC [Chitinophagia bacterium]